MCHNFAPESAAVVGARTDFREEGPNQNSEDEELEQTRTVEEEQGEAEAEENDPLTEQHLSLLVS